MTLELICSGFNLIGILVPVAFSFGIMTVHQVPYFRSWSLSYALAFAALALEGIGAATGHPTALTAIEAWACLASAWFSLKTAGQLDASSQPGNGALLGLGAAWAAYVGLAMAGQPFEVAFAPALLAYLATQLALGRGLMRQDRVTGAPSRLLGAVVILTGLWLLAYPPLLWAGHPWVGSLVSGLLHLSAGIGMVVFLLSDVASELQRRNMELESVEALQAEFIRNMSHEFRTPLAALKNGAWILSSYDVGRLSDAQRDVVGIIGANVDRFAGLVETVLDYSKLEAGTLDFEFAPQDLRPRLENAVQSMKQLFEANHLVLVSDWPTTPVLAIADGRRIEQVVTNLLSNALKFTPDGGRVVLRARQEGDEATIEVEDSGIGLDVADLERVFTKFYQVGDPRARRLPGTGLGLGLCRTIVEQHAGRISVRRNAGPGVTFSVRLPAPGPWSRPSPRSSTRGARGS